MRKNDLKFKWSGFIAGPGRDPTKSRPNPFAAWRWLMISFVLVSAAATIGYFWVFFPPAQEEVLSPAVLQSIRFNEEELRTAAEFLEERRILFEELLNQPPPTVDPAI